MTARCVEVRSYELHPGALPGLQALFEAEVAPMLAASGQDVVYAGPSLHEADAFVLIRAYASEDDRAARQDAFYGSDAWRQGPREPMLAMIKAYTSAVLPMDTDTLEAWRGQLNAKVFGEGMVDAAGIEPATPTMST